MSTREIELARRLAIDGSTRETRLRRRLAIAPPHGDGDPVRDMMIGELASTIHAYQGRIEEVDAARRNLEERAGDIADMTQQFNVLSAEISRVRVKLDTLTAKVDAYLKRKHALIDLETTVLMKLNAQLG